MFSDAEIDVATARLRELMDEMHDLCIKFDLIEFVRIIVPKLDAVEMMGCARIGGANHVQAILAAGDEGVDIANMIMEYGHESDAVVELTAEALDAESGN